MKTPCKQRVLPASSLQRGAMHGSSHLILCETNKIYFSSTLILQKNSLFYLIIALHFRDFFYFYRYINNIFIMIQRFTRCKQLSKKKFIFLIIKVLLKINLIKLPFFPRLNQKGKKNNFIISFKIYIIIISLLQI